MEPTEDQKEKEGEWGAKEKYAPEVVATADGSHTLFIPALGEHYHSFHSSVREAFHVYIDAGLRRVFAAKSGRVDVFEMGFGTGLNALVTALTASECNRSVHLRSIEFYPLNHETTANLNYCGHISIPGAQACFDAIQQAEWGHDAAITPAFTLHKFKDDFLQWQPPATSFDLIYYDAFGFRAQAELWEVSVFQKCHAMLRQGGILVTYASKGLVRRNMLEAGFEVEKLPGPPGKREMVRATKKS